MRKPEKGRSRSAKKMMKKAKRTKPNGEPVYYLILKLLMIVPFAYSGFFYGGVTIVGIMGKYIEPVPAKVGAVGNGGRRCCYVCRNIVCVFKNISFPLYLALGA